MLYSCAKSLSTTKWIFLVRPPTLQITQAWLVQMPFTTWERPFGATPGASKMNQIMTLWMLLTPPLLPPELTTSRKCCAWSRLFLTSIKPGWQNWIPLSTNSHLSKKRIHLCCADLTICSLIQARPIMVESTINLLGSALEWSSGMFRNSVTLRRLSFRWKTAWSINFLQTQNRF